MPERYRTVVAIHLLLIRDGAILLGERRNTGWADGMFHLPGGHLERGESLLEASCREADEELGISVDHDDARLVHVLHRLAVGDARVDFFFTVTRWQGELLNREPDKCARLEWFALDRLPATMVAYGAKVLGECLAGREFSVFGWNPAEAALEHASARGL